MSGKGKNCQGNDAFQRMNFLYQASSMMAEVNPILSSYYGGLCKSVAKKSVQRMHPDIKRTMCKRCDINLKPGITADIAFSEQNSKLFILRCKQCNCSKHFQLHDKYQMWLDDPESVAAEPKT